MRQKYWLSLSFGNLVYLRAWTDLFHAAPADAFFQKTLPGLGLYLGIAGDVFALSLLTFAVLCIEPRLPGWLRRALPLVGIGIVALAIRSIAAGSLVRSRLVGAPLAAVVAILVICAALWFSSATVRVARGAALAAMPCLAVTFVGSLVYLQARTPLPADPPLAARLTGTPPVRVLWILFDELDQRMMFEDRTPGTLLPVIDDLSTRSFTASHALAVQAGRMPVSDMSTYGAIPSLLYGRFLVRAGIEDARTMQIDFTSAGASVFSANAPVVFGEGETIFSRVRARGWNAALAGWYLPFCRVLASQLSECYWDTRYLQTYSASHEFPQSAVDETRMLFETSAFSPFGPSLVDVRHFGEYQALMTAGRRYAADPTIGLAFIHLNVPHTPYFYDPKIGPSFRYGLWGSLYPEALGWVDRAVGDILASVKQAGLDSKTAVIISSDHPFRYSVKQDPAVPFIVHLPGNEAGVSYGAEFSAVVTTDLALAIAGGEVKSPADVEGFLRGRRWQ